MKISEFISNHCTCNDTQATPLDVWIKAHPGSSFDYHINRKFINNAILALDKELSIDTYGGSNNIIRVNIASNNTGTIIKRAWNISFISNNGICTEAKVTYNKTIICITDDFDEMIQALVKHCKTLEHNHKKILDNKAINKGNIPHMILQELRDLAKDKFEVNYDPKSPSPYMLISEPRNDEMPQFRISISFEELEATIKVLESGVVMLKEIINLADRGEDPDGFKNVITLLAETLPAIRKKHLEEMQKVKLSDLLKG